MSSKKQIFFSIGLEIYFILFFVVTMRNLMKQDVNKAAAEAAAEIPKVIYRRKWKFSGIINRLEACNLIPRIFNENL